MLNRNVVRNAAVSTVVGGGLAFAINAAKKTVVVDPLRAALFMGAVSLVGKVVSLANDRFITDPFNWGGNLLRLATTTQKDYQKDHWLFDHKWIKSIKLTTVASYGLAAWPVWKMLSLYEKAPRVFSPLLKIQLLSTVPLATPPLVKAVSQVSAAVFCVAIGVDLLLAVRDGRLDALIKKYIG